MIWKIEVAEKEGFTDPVGVSIKKDIDDLGFKGHVDYVKTVSVYLLEGHLSEANIRTISASLLTDPITQRFSYRGNVLNEKKCEVLEIAYNPGVMDPVEESVKRAIIDLGIKEVSAVKTIKKYLIKGILSAQDTRIIGDRILYNRVIQHIVTGPSTIYPEPPSYQFKLKYVNIINAKDARLKKISRQGQLFLNLEEMRQIQRYFKHLKRDPTDCELETLSQTWSEHCKHKTFRGKIEYIEKNPSASAERFGGCTPKSQRRRTKSKVEKIDNLLKSTIMRVTKELKKKWCVSVFKDNSGIIRFDEKYNVCFKVETHNHPSALEPYGGAGTGLGGVIRDPLGTGLGAKPIINTDVFCFGLPDYPYKKLPKGVLHPKRVMKGVVAGVRDYGNRMGIPTSNGAVLFDENFTGNPLVFCGNVGIMPKEKSFKKVERGDYVVLVGGRTGRDGIHGATFSSAELTHESKDISGSSVQIGNPIQEKKMADALLKCRDIDLYNAITDCGAGGLSSAVGEMGEDLGVEVHLDRVPLKYKGLTYTEIWISEAQERMTLAVNPEKIEKLNSIFESEDVEATVIGRFTGDNRLKLFYEDHMVADIDMEFLHNRLPDITRKAIWGRPDFKEPILKHRRDLTQDLLALLSNLNIASKEWIIRQYDHEVQGGSVLKPLQGVDGGGPGDASVTRPILDSKRGIILSCGINPDYGKIDPYWMAASCIDEALRQIVSVGGDIKRAALLDNFCWGNTDKPDRLGGLVRAAKACYDIAKGYGVPFISGKDSLNNEYSTGKKTISIPPTLLISCIAVMDDISTAISMDAKRPGNAIYLVGITHNELGGSQYYKMKGFIGSNIPKVNPFYARRVMNALNRAINNGYVVSCHDCSDGGMAVSLSEMAFAGGLGMRIQLGGFSGSKKNGMKGAGNEMLLFSESNSRFIAEVGEERKFISAMKGIPIRKLGILTDDGAFKIFARNKDLIVDTDIKKMKSAWQSPFKDM